MKRQKNNFTLVEIILSMGIIMVCIITIMGMFSASMKISKESTMTTYSNMISEQLVGFINKYPSARSKVQEVFMDSDNLDYPRDGTELQKIWKEHYDVRGEKWDSGWNIKNKESQCDVQVDPDDEFLKNVFYRSQETTFPYGLLTVNFITNTNGTNVTDFTVMARMWYENAQPIKTSYDPTVSTVTIYQYLNIELTWPHHMPYNNRLLSGNVLKYQKVLSQ